ncbi:16S rRNA (cytidine(1402)-2'-O)-methyltransferase [Bacillus sp. PS06]|uniref:16S rRNA (cytidine(1402)-2'-O)-methyltransferase n=1 Tax=Bacillus sp. PS06 TaxID=2764176 RepID=UPI00177AD4DA|nr:16S rRNA (cytidine(1402)-2'-O)-methyltransferase [Bacillus sp. PS06]MBD8071032.1 16S rRNA (cytidine(1402)-2'-O)-methyltransferase [Bacillus sp. PS06]
MWQQKSFQGNADVGTLYLVPTPIGNLDDMTFRAIKTLKEADIIAAEDTRHSKKLCNYFEITTPIISYHDHNKEVSGDKIIGLLKEGKNIALVSDAGLPTISDPGYELVVQAVSEKLFVVPLPGANAALTAMIASGLRTQPFYFYGFLDRQKKEKKLQLEGLKRIEATLIFYEAPHRLKETLQVMREILGNRQISISRELTKKFEEFIRGDLDRVIEWSKSDQIRGEFCLIVEGANSSDLEAEEDESWWIQFSIEEHVNHYITNKEFSVKDAIKEVSKDRQLPKREIYNTYHK